MNRRQLTTLCLLLSAWMGCGDSMVNKRPCSDSGDCFSDESCLANSCVFDGSLQEGDTCTRHRQCQGALACRSFVCAVGCSEPYSTLGCDPGSWCAPDASGRSGDCLKSQCNPLQTSFCVHGDRCIALASETGTCLPGCDYGFLSGSYQDTCEQPEKGQISCQPVGINNTSACLPAGTQQSPGVGDAGCSLAGNPCKAGSVCINIVCRQLCSNGSAESCSPGEDCVPLEPARHIYYCRAR